MSRSPEILHTCSTYGARLALLPQLNAGIGDPLLPQSQVKLPHPGWRRAAATDAVLATCVGSEAAPSHTSPPRRASLQL
jgi:hypothetical protein